jgi:hypothetical protein
MHVMAGFAKEMLSRSVERRKFSQKIAKIVKAALTSAQRMRRPRQGRLMGSPH